MISYSIMRNSAPISSHDFASDTGCSGSSHDFLVDNFCTGLAVQIRLPPEPAHDLKVSARKHNKKDQRHNKEGKHPEELVESWFQSYGPPTGRH